MKSTSPFEDGAGLAGNPVVARIPIELDVAVPIRNFRVRNLLDLERGQFIESIWQQGEDLPLAAPGTQLAWSEFEGLIRNWRFGPMPRQSFAGSPIL